MSLDRMCVNSSPPLRYDPADTEAIGTPALQISDSLPPSFTKTNKSSVDNVSAPNQCLKSVVRRRIELCNIFNSAEFVLLHWCMLVTYFSASLAPTPSCKPLAVLWRERARLFYLSLTIKRVFLQNTRSGLQLRILQGVAVATRQPWFPCELE